MNSPRPLRNPFWGLLVVAATVFCVSAIATLATGLGDPDAPLSRFFNRHGAAVVAGSAIATMLFGGLALTTDRLQTLCSSRKPHARQDAAHESDGPDS